MASDGLMDQLERIDYCCFLVNELKRFLFKNINLNQRYELKFLLDSSVASRIRASSVA